MNNKTYEGNAVLTIEAFDFKQYKDFVWYPESKSFWNGHKKEGFESKRGGGHRYLVSELESGNGGGVFQDIIYRIKDKKAYYRPHVSIKFIDGSYADKQFETFKEAQEYAEEMIKKTIQIPIQINK